MTFKDKKKFEEWVIRYRNPYVKEYMKQKRQQENELKEHIQKGEWDLAKLLAGKKPSVDTSLLKKMKQNKEPTIDLFGFPKERKRTRK